VTFATSVGLGRDSFSKHRRAHNRARMNDDQAIRYQIADRSTLRAEYFALRRRIFCEEQRVFTVDDRDQWDEIALPIVGVLARPGAPERVVGVVRIYEESRGVWYGGRLGVDAEYRKLATIGRSLIFKAVTTAHGRGCTSFLALVQPQNAAFFRRLHWRAIGEVESHSRPHVLMEADLAFYPPASADEASIAKGTACHDAA
jgi:putative N-acetyltransferase (TIGR04045 family)